MREIKFRIWDTSQKKFWFDKINLALNGTRLSIDHNIVLCQDVYIPQQFTGLKDKNGKNIYEGDIVKAEGGEHFEIKYIDASFVLNLGNKDYVNLSSATLAGSLILHWKLGVIGNIFENPELLK